MLKSKKFYKIRGITSYGTFLQDRRMWISLPSQKDTLIRNLHSDIDSLSMFFIDNSGNSVISEAGMAVKVKQRFFIILDSFIPYK